MRGQVRHEEIRTQYDKKVHDELRFPAKLNHILQMFQGLLDQFIIYDCLTKSNRTDTLVIFFSRIEGDRITDEHRKESVMVKKTYAMVDIQHIISHGGRIKCCKIDKGKNYADSEQCRRTSTHELFGEPSCRINHNS